MAPRKNSKLLQMHMKYFLIQTKDGSMINKVMKELKEMSKVEAVQTWIWMIFSHHSSEVEEVEGEEVPVVDSSSISAAALVVDINNNNVKR